MFPLHKKKFKNYSTPEKFWNFVIFIKVLENGVKSEKRARLLAPAMGPE